MKCPNCDIELSEGYSGAVSMDDFKSIIESKFKTGQIKSPKGKKPTYLICLECGYQKEL